MQYSQGICDATARPISSFCLPFNAVVGFICRVFISSQAPGKATSGNALMKPGVNPHILWTSARAAAASLTIWAFAAPAASATTIVHTNPTSFLIWTSLSKLSSTPSSHGRARILRPPTEKGYGSSPTWLPWRAVPAVFTLQGERGDHEHSTLRVAAEHGIAGSLGAGGAGRELRVRRARPQEGREPRSRVPGDQPPRQGSRAGGRRSGLLRVGRDHPPPRRDLWPRARPVAR